jgi:hypothetical protein
LASAFGVIDHECAPAVSVPETCAPGFVDTLIVTKEFAWGRWSTMAVHGIPVAALEGDAVSAASASVEIATALSVRATRATGIRIKAFTFLTVPVAKGSAYAPLLDLMRTGLDGVARS